MHDQVEHAKVQRKELKKLQQLQQQKQEQKVEDKGCPREIYAQLWGPKFLSRPWILHNTPRIIKDNAITQLN